MVRGCRCAMSWCDLDLTFNLAIVTLCGFAQSWCHLDLTFDLALVSLTYKILSRLYLGNCKVQEVDTDIG